jgi:hypothetical protein
LSLFDLLFLIMALATLMALIVATLSVMRGRRDRALRLVQRLALVWLACVLANLIVSGLRHQRIVRPHEAWCFDDWCFTQDSMAVGVRGDTAVYFAHFTLSSRALRVRQRAKGAWIYLMDSEHRRYAPVAEAGDVPLDIELGPGERHSAQRRFEMPFNDVPVGLITGHGGRYCGIMNFLIIGEAGCVFGKPTMVGLAGLPGSPLP